MTQPTFTLSEVTDALGVAAVKCGRRFVGIEQNERWFDLTCKRIAAALRQPSMFIDPPKPMKQEALL